MKKRKLRKPSILKLAFYGAAASVGVLLAVSAIRKNRTLEKNRKKLVRKTKYAIKRTTGELSKRQVRILKLFDKEDKITNEMIKSVITGVSNRTIRRDLDFLEEKGYVKQVGKTRGSYYELV